LNNKKKKKMGQVENDGPPQPNPAPSVGRASVVIVLATVFIDLLGFGIVLPLLPFYAISLGGAPSLLFFTFPSSPSLTVMLLLLLFFFFFGYFAA
jgi:hypothetical protein